MLGGMPALISWRGEKFIGDSTKPIVITSVLHSASLQPLTGKFYSHFQSKVREHPSLN